MTDLFTVDTNGQPYQLRRESRYDYNFQKPLEVTSWMLARGGNNETARDSTRFRYDVFGRFFEKSSPEDRLDAPSVRVTYDLKDPMSEVRIETRSQPNAPFDELQIQCLDGAGRLYQDRVRLEANRFQVEGFRAYNARGAEVQVWQPYISTSPTCERQAPNNVKLTTSRYDALDRLISRTAPGLDVYGEDLETKIVYRPLTEERFDPEDLLTGGPHFDTPTIIRRDGLGRTLEIKRSAQGDSGRIEPGDRLFYDETGTFAGYENARGHRHTLTTDLMGRTTQVSNANFGTIQYTYDAASNITSIVDGRGVDQRRSYDGLNRIAARWNEADRASTEVNWVYDIRPDDCLLTECTNVAGQLAAIRYPIRLMNGITTTGLDRFGYDVQRRRVFSGRRLEGLADLVTRVGFDHRDRVVSITHPDNTTVTSQYDGLGRVVAVDGYIRRVAYEARGMKSELDLNNGAQVRWTYDSLKRLASIEHRDASNAVIHDLAIQRNRANFVTRVIDSGAGSIDLSTDLILDDWYRTGQAAFATGTETFSFDELDRVTSIEGADVDYGTARPLAATRGRSTYTALRRRWTISISKRCQLRPR